MKCAIETLKLLPSFTVGFDPALGEVFQRLCFQELLARVEFARNSTDSSVIQGACEELIRLEYLVQQLAIRKRLFYPFGQVGWELYRCKIRAGKLTLLEQVYIGVGSTLKCAHHALRRQLLEACPPVQAKERAAIRLNNLEETLSAV